jgi:hypothetical protein
MPIRLKVVRRKEEQISKVKGLMDMFNVNSNTNSYYYQYQPTGASNFSNLQTNIDPRVQKTKDLFQMFHLAR